MTYHHSDEKTRVDGLHTSLDGVENGGKIVDDADLDESSVTCSPPSDVCHERS